MSDGMKELIGAWAVKVGWERFLLVLSDLAREAGRPDVAEGLIRLVKDVTEGRG